MEVFSRQQEPENPERKQFMGLVLQDIADVLQRQGTEDSFDKINWEFEIPEELLNLEMEVNP